MRIVVTGASGFVGTALVRELQRRGIETIATVRHPPDPLPVGTTVVQSSDDAPLGDVLVHLAEGRRMNAMDDASVQQLIRRCGRLLGKGYARPVYASSALVYGDRETHPRRPEEQPAPESPYARAKLACEEIVTERRGLVARLANVYGPGMARDNVVSDVLEQIPGDGPLTVRDPLPVRDFLWIEDAARGLADMAVGTGLGIFNLGSGTGVSVGDLARLALDLAGQSDRPVVASQPSQKPSSLSLDISSTASTFGWAPQVPLSGGLAQLQESRP